MAATTTAALRRTLLAQQAPLRTTAAAATARRCYATEAAKTGPYNMTGLYALLFAVYDHGH